MHCVLIDLTLTNNQHNIDVDFNRFSGQGEILLDNLGCTGRETNIWNCPHSGIKVHNCGHGEDVGVQCA